MSFALRGLGFLLFLILYPPLLPPRRRGFFRGFVVAIISERQPTVKDFCDPLAADGVQRLAITCLVLAHPGVFLPALLPVPRARSEAEDSDLVFRPSARQVGSHVACARSGPASAPSVGYYLVVFIA